MNKSDLINAIAASTNLPKSQVGEVLDGFVDAVKGGLAKGEKVSIPGIVSFEPKAQAARTARNPATGAEIKVAAKTVVKVKAGKVLQDAVA